MDGVLTRCMSLESIPPSLTAFHDERRRSLTTTSTRPSPLLLCAGRYWDRRASSCVQEFWRPAHPPVSCAFVSKGLFVQFPVVDCFSGGYRGSAMFRCGRLVDGEYPGVSRVCRVVWCVREQPGRYCCQYTSSSSVTFPPCRCADGVAHVVTIDETRAERGRAVARCRRHLEKRPPPGVVGHVVGTTVSGPVVGSGRPRSTGESRVALFFWWRGRTNFATPSGVVHPNEAGRRLISGGAAAGLVAVAPGHQHQGFLSRSQG